MLAQHPENRTACSQLPATSLPSCSKLRQSLSFPNKLCTDQNALASQSLSEVIRGHPISTNHPAASFPAPPAPGLTSPTLTSAIRLLPLGSCSPLHAARGFPLQARNSSEDTNHIPRNSGVLGPFPAHQPAGSEGHGFGAPAPHPSPSLHPTPVLRALVLLRSAVVRRCVAWSTVWPFRWLCFDQWQLDHPLCTQRQVL